MHLAAIAIISGGQTSSGQTWSGKSDVDRGALDAALAAGASCGGWGPEVQMSDDGPIPDRYPLQVLPGSGYRKRTRVPHAHAYTQGVIARCLQRMQTRVGSSGGR